MAQISVSSNQLKSRRDQLEQYNSRLEQLRSSYEDLERRLNAQWEGDAKNNFHNTFLQNMENLRSLSDAVKQYCSVLQDIICKYESTEAQNASLASTR